MAEQAINTIYALGEQPDALCSEIIKDLSQRVFASRANRQDDEKTEPKSQAEANQPPLEQNPEEGNIDEDPQVQTEPDVRKSATPAIEERQTADAFQLAQLLFATGHVSVRHLLHLELLEREFKRRKAETEKKEKEMGKAVATEELDQVVGSVEDDIADVVAHVKEKELLYGPDSLLAVFGPMAVAICSQPKLYKVSIRKRSTSLETIS